MIPRAGAFLQRRPLFGAAVACALAVVLWQHGAWAGGLAAVGFTAVAARLGGGKAAGWIALALCIALGVCTFRTVERDRLERVLTGLEPSRVTGRVLADAEGGPEGWEAPVRLAGGPGIPAADVHWRGTGAPPVQGAKVSAEGSFLPLPSPRNPGEFDKRSWLVRQDIAARFLEARGSGTQVETGTVAALGNRLRREFRLAVTTGLDPGSREERVIRAVVVGEYPREDESLVEAFRNSGSLHVFSVSGMHVAMAGSLGWLVLRLLRVPRKAAVPLLIALMFGYAWLTGNSPPALRAAWMGAVFLGAFVFQRRPDLLSALGAVLLVATLWDGRLLLQPGVQLSYGVVAALGLGSGWFSRRFERFVGHDSYLPSVLLTPWQVRWCRGKRQVANVTAASCAACIGSTPLTLWYFGMATPAAVLASLAMAIPLYLLLGVALLSCIVYPLSPAAAGAMNRLNGGVARVCSSLASACAAVPGGNLRIDRAGKPFLLVYDLEHGAVAACFAGKEGAVLLDCGDVRSFRYRVAPSLKRLAVEPDAMVLSQPDGGHVATAEAVNGVFPLKQVLLPVDRAKSPGYQSWWNTRDPGLERLRARKGMRLPFPDSASLEVLDVPDGVPSTARAEDRVAVFRLHWRGWKILFTGDAGRKAEARLLASGQDLKADVIVAGRHSDGMFPGEAFMDAVAPRAIVIGRGKAPAGRSDPAQAAWWRQNGIAVFDQGACGGVTLRADGEALELAGFVDGSVVTLTR